MAKQNQIDKELSDHSDVISQVAVWGHKMLAEFGMDLDDCAQEVRIACIITRPNWSKSHGCLGAFWNTCARNHMRGMFKKLKTRAIFEGVFGHDVQSPEDFDMHRMATYTVRAITVSSLGDRHKAVLVARIAGESLEEIGERLSITPKRALELEREAMDYVVKYLHARIYFCKID